MLMLKPTEQTPLLKKKLKKNWYKPKDFAALDLE